MAKIGRFQVMATLQAARAYVLGREIEEAKSFGLNRAIFYAAAKKGFKPKIKPLEERKVKIPEKRKEMLGKFEIDRIGDEMAYYILYEGKKIYVIGNELQTEENFKKQIELRFKGKFEEAFREAIEICEKYERGILLSQRAFYEIVYKPRRDELAKKWSEMVEM